MRSAAIHPPYIPLTQQRLCCVPCAVQWILLRRKLPIFTQEKIGAALLLVVPPRCNRLFGDAFRVSGRKPPRGYGTQTEDATPFNAFLRSKRLPLRVKHLRHSELKNPERTIVMNLKKGNDVMIITFMSPVDKRRQWGHALLVSKIELGKKPAITVGDPNFTAAKFYDLPLEKLLRGMTKRVGKVERGIYIFSKTR